MPSARYPVHVKAVVLSLICVVSSFAQDAAFVSLAKEYVDRYLEAYPERATVLGNHRFDRRLQDYSRAAIARTLSLNLEYMKRLRVMPVEGLSATNRIDHQILESAIESQIWTVSVLREHEWNPMVYNPGSAIYSLLERDFAPLPQRLESVRARLEAIPLRIAQGKANLKDASKIHVETAILQNKGTISLVRDVVGKYFESVPEMRPKIAPAQEKAIAALEDWNAHLQNEILPKASRDFRLGPQKYAEKLRFALSSDLTVDAVRQQAERDLRDTQGLMYDSALPLYRKFFTSSAGTADRKKVIRAVLDKLSENRPDAATIVAQATHDLAEATEFVKNKNLMTVYDTPLRIIEMPEFQRGVAVASCASPGPLDRKGVTFFNISPPPSTWNPEQVESYFREYNDYMVKNLTVHEAMPGHYLQRAHANRFEAPTLVRAIFWSGTFTEGWAVYAERIMADAGYGGPEVRMQQLKMRLRMIINALIDQGIHARGMTEQQAMDLMIKEGFQEKSEAAGKWRRACLTSAQLSTYYVGGTEMDQLRTAYQRKFGAITDWRGFHDLVLSFGSPAPKYVRQAMGL